MINAIREHLAVDPQAPDDQLRRHVVDSVSDVIVYPKKITIRLQPDHADAIEIPWQAPAKKSPALPPPSIDTDQPDSKLLQAIVRAHAWLRDLQSGKFDSVEALALSVKLHPKVVRQQLRYAFLAPSINEIILTGEQLPSLTLARIPKTLPMTWSEHIVRWVI